MREFRVKKIVRYIVTDWADHAGGSCVEVCGPSTLEQANAMAEGLGAANPGSLVNKMEPESESYGAPLDIGALVNRFLTWRLPDNFNPDAGISFKPMFNEHTDHPMRHRPMGTNLFDYTQAEAMIRHLLANPA